MTTDVNSKTSGFEQCPEADDCEKRKSGVWPLGQTPSPQVGRIFNRMSDFALKTRKESYGSEEGLLDVGELVSDSPHGDQEAWVGLVRLDAAT